MFRLLISLCLVASLCWEPCHAQRGGRLRDWLKRLKAKQAEQAKQEEVVPDEAESEEPDPSANSESGEPDEAEQDEAEPDEAEPDEAEVEPEKPEATCTVLGQEKVPPSRLDIIIRRMQKTGQLKRIWEYMAREIKKPDSLLTRLLGNGVIDPTTFNEDDNSALFMSKVPAAFISKEMINNIVKYLGAGKTVFGYLWRYGFIAKVLNLSENEAENYGGAIPECALTNAIREFQIFNKLEKQDGTLNAETVNKMAEDRCGNYDVKCTTPRCLADDRYNSQGGKLRRRRYAVRRKKWKGSRKGNVNIAYFYENMYNPHSTNETDKTGHDTNMTPEIVKREVEKGLSEWTKYSGINFIEVDDIKRAAVKIRFGPTAHGEKNEKRYFDGPYGVLAHMYYPRDGKMHFDEAENYTASNYKPGINLHFVTAHEMGHGLGIEHSNKPSALMAPYYIGYREQMLKADDIKAIRHLYGIGNGLVSPLEGDAIVAPEGLATGIDKGETVVVRKEGADSGKLVKGGDKTEESEGKSKADKCAKGSQVTFQDTKDLGHCIEGFSAGFQDPTEDHIYLFYNENHYLRLESGHQNMKFPRVSEPETSYSEMLVSNKFPGLEGPYDAAVTDNNLQITYFFVDGTVTTWDWSTDTVGDLNREPIENTQFSGIPNSEEIHAVAKYHDQFIFFCGDEYYIFTTDDGVSGPFEALIEEEKIASAFHSFYNGYVYTTTDSFVENSVYNLMSAKKLTAGAGDAAAFQATVMRSYNDVDMTDDTMFGWPCGLGFCGLDLEDIRPGLVDE